MKTFIKVTKAILNVITTIVIILGLLFVGLFLFGIQPYVVESGSMEPVIHTGSVCFINKNAKYDDMQVNDIIAFKLDSGVFATHRIVYKTEEGFETKGDANNNKDSVIITKENFIGKNIFSIPNAGFIVKGLQTTRGKIILTTVIIVIFLAGVLIGEPSKKKEKNSEYTEEKKKE